MKKYIALYLLCIMTATYTYSSDDKTTDVAELNRALISAAQAGDLKIMTLLLDRGAQIDAQDRFLVRQL